jgi:choline transporter-like protein 2/4/5
LSNGDLQKLIVPTDSNGRKCGVDSDVQDNPFLLFFDITKCANSTCNTIQVCQKKCPDTNFFYQNHVGLLEDVKKNIICKSDINVNLIDTWDQLDYYVAQNKCARWYMNSESINKRCIPKYPIPIEFQSVINNNQLNISKEIILQVAILEKRLEDIYHDIVSAG